MDLDSARRILLCLRYGIGDVVMELPVLDALRHAVRQAHLTVLGASPAVGLLIGDARVDEVVSIAQWGLEHRWDEGTPETRTELADWLRRQAFDLVLDAHHAAIAVGKMAWGLGIRTVESDEGAEAAAVAAGFGAVAAIKASVREGWGLVVPDESLPYLPLTDGEQAAAAALLDRWGVETNPAPIGLLPVASLPMKRWPVDRFATVADRLAIESGRPVLLFGGPEVDEADDVMGLMRYGDRAIRVGAAPLRLTAALLARCALVLGNDTGLLHLAATVGTPVVGIFGPSVPEIYRPPFPWTRTVGGRDIDCPHRNTRSLHPPGCWASSHCLIANHSCVDRVSVDDVIDAARAMLHDDRTQVRTDRDVRRTRRDPSAA